MEIRRKRRGNSRYFIAFLALTVGLGGVLLGLRLLGSHINWFNLRTLNVQGCQTLPKSMCLSLIEDYKGVNLFDVSRKEIRERFEQLPRIKKATVRFILPARMDVIIEERRTAFWVLTRDGRAVPIDSDRVVLDTDLDYVHEDAPLVNLNILSHELMPGEAIEHPFLERVYAMQASIGEAADWLAGRVSQYYQLGDEVVFVESNSGSRIILGEDNLDEKLRRLVFFAENKGFSPNTTLDLRFPDQIVAKMGVK